MPISSPNNQESKKDFISRCMSEMSKEFPDQKQRAGVCYSQWEDKKAKASYVVSTQHDEIIYNIKKKENNDKPTTNS